MLDTASIPPEIQTFASLLVVVLATLLAAWRYARVLAPPSTPPPSPDVVITGGALADRIAMQELSAALRSATTALQDHTQATRDLSRAISQHTSLVEAHERALPVRDLLSLFARLRE